MTVIKICKKLVYNLLEAVKNKWYKWDTYAHLSNFAGNKMQSTMKKAAIIRHMQVYNKAVERGGNSYIRYYVRFPEIRLMGKWLQECGFQPGQQIKISTEAIM